MRIQAKYAALALAFLTSSAISQQSLAFQVDAWGAQWRTPTYELRFNYWLDVQSILHVKGGELLCADGHKVNLPGDEDIIPLVHPVWDYNKSAGWENVKKTAELDLFHTKEIPPGMYYILFRDDLEGKRSLDMYDLTKAPKIVKQVNDVVNDYCTGKKKPSTPKYQDSDQRSDGEQIPPLVVPQQ